MGDFRKVRRPADDTGDDGNGKWASLTKEVLSTLDTDRAIKFIGETKVETEAARSACWGPANNAGLKVRSRRVDDETIFLWVERRPVGDDVPEL